MPESIAVRSATPYLIVRGAARAIQFYVEAFGAIEADRMVGSDGRIEHAELRIAASRLYLADEHPEIEMIVGPESLGGTSVIIDLEVDDVEAVFERAVVAGAREVRPVDHPSSGVQSAKVIDPFGHVWLITRIVGS